MHHDIFISYSSKNAQIAIALVHCLEENGIRCWIAPRNISAGKEYADEIVSAIGGAKAVLILFSDAAQLSQWVRSELNTAMSAGKTIIPVKIEDVLPKGAMQLYLGDKHWIDIFPRPERNFGRVVEEVRRLVVGVDNKRVCNATEQCIADKDICKENANGLRSLRQRKYKPRIREITIAHSVDGRARSPLRAAFAIKWLISAGSEYGGRGATRPTVCPTELAIISIQHPSIMLACRFVLGVSIVCLLVGISLFIWEDLRTVNYKYADYVIAYGLPQGLFLLTDEEVSHRHIHYRFEYRGLKYWPNCVHEDTSAINPFRFLGFKRVLRRVDQANSAGIPISIGHTELGNRPQIQVFEEYDSDGTLRKMHHALFAGSDTEPKLIRCLLFSDKMGTVNAIVESVGKDRSEQVFAKAVSLGGYVDDHQREVSEITQYAITRDQDGRALTVAFYDAKRRRVCDAEGVGGFRFVRDGSGRILKRVYLGVTGRECPLKNGVVARSYEYRDSVMTSATYLDSHWEPIRNAYGWARVIDEFDGWGNNIRSVFCGENGARILNGIGVAECRNVYDLHGNMKSSHYFNVDGSPCTCKDGYAGFECTYDRAGNMMSMKFLDENGKPCLHRQGYAGIQTEYSEQRLITRQIAFGIDGSPCLTKDGFAELRRKYDKRGNLVSERCYGVDGKLCLRSEGVAGGDGEFDSHDREVRLVCVGVNGKPCLNKYGYAEIRTTYDERGNTKSQSVYDVDGNPCLSTDGYAAYLNYYDDRGLIVRMLYHGIDGKPCLTKAGIAECRYVYDERGNSESKCFYGVDGKKCLDKQGIAEMRSSYDAYGNVTSICYYGVDGKPCLHADGIAECRMMYNVRGDVISVRYYGIDGKLCLDKNGVAGVDKEYDDKRRNVRAVWVGVDGKPCLHGFGMAEQRLVYDSHGNVKSVLYYGVDGKPCLSQDGYFKMTSEFDDQGNEIGRFFWGVDGRLCSHRDGISGWTSEFDDLRREIHRTFRGVDGKPCIHKDGNAEFRCTYDMRGNQTSMRFYGTDGNLCLHKDGISGWTSEYDNRGQEIRRLFFGVDGKPCLHKVANAAGWTAEYDERGHLVWKKWIGTDGALCASEKAECRYTYDVRGNLTSIRYYDARGNPYAIGDNGFVGFCFHYDKYGQFLSVSACNSNGTNSVEVPKEMLPKEMWP